MGVQKFLVLSHFTVSTFALVMKYSQPRYNLTSHCQFVSCGRWDQFCHLPESVALGQEWVMIEIINDQLYLIQ